MDAWVEEHSHRHQPLSESALHCDVTFVVHSPRKPANPYPLGDVDNYLKAIWDSLQGRAFFKDDKQIESVNAVKRYVVDGEEPHILITFKDTR